jgi:hypothetical protein
MLEVELNYSFVDEGMLYLRGKLSIVHKLKLICFYTLPISPFYFLGYKSPSQSIFPTKGALSLSPWDKAVRSLTDYLLS